ncbi:hypothetical protein LTR78_008283 [Recurvomyces mirabilis]|uniref:RING-type domain-containing protein n=1 Tax=Recurvomyces mirabilis TaxID=574656 RepID=A0AAE0TQK1_9PEZI|nr:hypothetical protein LTR78_008283 [Recurvomyces mirabilis]KAK5156568.1 hypothetical protein LTS14_004780 [Recurvomyces mirabilis]
MAFPYANKEAYELSGVPKEIDEARLQQFKTAGKFIGDGDCVVCAKEYFTDSVRPILLHSSGSETLHIICDECYSKQYDDDEQGKNVCPYCRLELFLLPDEVSDEEEEEDDDDVVRALTPEDHIRLTRFRIEQIQRGDRHENIDLLDDRLLSSDLRYVGRENNQHGDLWWRDPLHAVDEQALRTVLEHCAAVYMDGELNISLSMYDAAYHGGVDAQMVRILGNPLNGTYTRLHSLDVDEISMVLRDGYYRRFLAANVNGSRGMVAHPLAMQAILTIEKTLRNERVYSQHHRPSTMYNTLCAALRNMGSLPHTSCEPDCPCEQMNERRAQGLETVLSDMVATVINVLKTGAYQEVPKIINYDMRYAVASRRESKIRWRRDHQISPARQVRYEAGRGTTGA